MLRISSSAFSDGGEIPARHTCEGRDEPPPLDIVVDLPGVVSLALIVDDPDAPDPRAPKRVWVHWVVADLSARTKALGGASPLPRDAIEGKNDFGGVGYRGPCPPVGRHRYFFKLYALDSPLAPRLGSLHQPTKAELLAAMEGHVLAEAELVGTYERRRR
jgi:Raf kinase inhibitor-like YbhB/YbcL family protein